ncbi:MAG TPA: phosphoenolpyruvate--protein phosphotransferase [Desulfuromonadales bacterium]|nr:phosphoenolpyruvate--protein phosphotransferase [Desulfuromonadales bacterium]
MPRTSTSKIGVTTLEDISALILQSHDLDETLRNVVNLVARRMRTDVCSIYLLDDGDSETLRLRATRGLSRRAVNKVTMRIGEGLTGMAAQNRHPVAIEEPQDHPSYRYFKETGEERFHSFLGIPLFDREHPLGVIVLQTREVRQFSKEEISALATIAFQISSIVVNARLLDSIHQKEKEALQVTAELAAARKSLADREEEGLPDIQHSLDGSVACPGVAAGPAAILEERLGFTDILHEEDVDVDFELQGLEGALEQTRIQTLFLEKQVAKRLTEHDASIFHSHLMILEDRSLIEKIKAEIRRGHCAAYALEKVVADYIEAFKQMEDPYLRERATDMEDIGRRLLGNLVGDMADRSLHLKHPGILVARQLLPSDMASFDPGQILGIITEVSGQNSHAVIMAKAMGIPALVGVRGALKHIAPEDELILDANSGKVYIRPDETIRKEYQRLLHEQTRQISLLDEYRHLDARTADGVNVTLRANIGLLSDISTAQRYGAKGVGLYRTEFPYMARREFPGRAEQYDLYRRVAEGFPDEPVTIRTLDIGGDKTLPYFHPPREDNPFMGWRSVRVSLDNREIFRTQIEAILMAGQHGRIRLLFPMISAMEEIRACKEVIIEAKQSLTDEGIDFAEDLPLGVMIEVPAAVHLVPRLAREVDFFALGTNDLVQYLLAADRNNPLVSRHYDPLHPAALDAIGDVCRAARAADRDLCLCGEMATDPLTLLPLLGMGLREFSMPAPFIPRIKAFLRGVNMKNAARCLEDVAQMDTSSQIRDHLQGVLAASESAA